MAVSGWALCPHTQLQVLCRYCRGKFEYIYPYQKIVFGTSGKEMRRGTHLIKNLQDPGSWQHQEFSWCPKLSSPHWHDSSRSIQVSPHLERFADGHQFALGFARYSQLICSGFAERRIATPTSTGWTGHIHPKRRLCSEVEWEPLGNRSSLLACFKRLYVEY